MVGRRRLLALGCAGLALPACRSITRLNAVLAGSPLRSLGEARGVAVGAAVQSRYLREEPYASVLAREFSMVVAEYEMKFEQLHPQPDRYAFGAADAIVAFTEAHRMRVRGHTLVW